MAQAESAQTLALVKTGVVDVVAQKIQGFMRAGEIRLPADYSAENALKSAWLILQTITTGKDDGKRPVLAVCTRDSIANALLDMVVQGLNPAKKQCYFIAYGKELICQRSYFGTLALAKRADPTIQEIVAEVVYEGDTFAYTLAHGKKTVTEHTQTLDAMSRPIKGAYCVVFYADGHQATTIMALNEIHQAWRQSRQNPFDDKGGIKPSSVHGRFPGEMAKKTVINRALKPIINSANDSYLFEAAINRADEVATDVEVAEAIAAGANMETLDVTALEEEPTPVAVPSSPSPAPATTQGDLLEGPGF